jgi:hypothetical protein
MAKFIEPIQDKEVLASRIEQLLEDKNSLQAGLKRHKRFINTFMTSESMVPGNYFEVESRLSNVEGYFKQYENITKHLKVYDKKEAKKYDEEEEAFEEEFFKTFTLFKRTLQNTKINKESEKVQMNTRRTNYKFPEVKLPNFDGNLENWILFRDLFESMVIKSTDLSPAEKMHYLIGALSEE